MSRQLTIFHTVEDSKIQAIQRYLDRAEVETKPTASISKYTPGGRKTEYYRLVYSLGRKVKALHINGGNCNARLANYRKERLQAMIDRGAELSYVLEQLADFNGKKNDEN